MAMKTGDALVFSDTISRHMEGLRRLQSMWLDPNVLFYDDPIPENIEGFPTIFLEGPTSRDGIPDYMWRKDAVFYLRSFRCIAQIFVPEPRGFSYLSGNERNGDFTDKQKIYQWEHSGRNSATVRIFWIPRNSEQLRGATTNREFGQDIERAKQDKVASRSLFIGWPDDAEKMGSLEFELQQAKVGSKEGGHFSSLKDLCKDVAKYTDTHSDNDIPF